MEKISFIKMSGAGNDFVVIDKNKNPEFALNDNIIRNICNRRNGIGADGFITIKSDGGEFDFIMEYFNADGSTGSLCGNGARCAIKFADFTGRISKPDTRFISNNVSYSGKVLNDGNIKFYFNKPGKTNLDLKIKTSNAELKGYFIDTGSPHVVIKVEDMGSLSFNDIDDLPVFELGREIRNLPDFAPGGTNVNFIQVKDNKIYIRTYERGVEDETLACGTGSTASALIGYYTAGLNPPVKLITKGRDELTVDFEIKGNEINNLSLTGPARITFTGEFLLNQFL